MWNGSNQGVEAHLFAVQRERATRLPAVIDRDEIGEVITDMLLDSVVSPKQGGDFGVEHVPGGSDLTQQIASQPGEILIQHLAG
jgi:hypothetical protein